MVFKAPKAKRPATAYFPKNTKKRQHCSFPPRRANRPRKIPFSAAWCRSLAQTPGNSCHALRCHTYTDQTDRQAGIASTSRSQVTCPSLSALQSRQGTTHSSAAQVSVQLPCPPPTIDGGVRALRPIFPPSALGTSALALAAGWEQARIKAASRRAERAPTVFCHVGNLLLPASHFAPTLPNPPPLSWKRSCKQLTRSAFPPPQLVHHAATLESSPPPLALPPWSPAITELQSRRRPRSS